VTDPRTPRYLAHIPGEEGKAEQGGAQMVRVCAGADLPKADKSKFYMLRVFGNQAHEVWDVSDPAKPALLTVIGKGLKGTHKNFWECDTGIAYLVSGHPQWRTNRMTQIYDLSDPPSRCSFATSVSWASSRARVARCRFHCTARSPPAPRAIACSSATAPIPTACCRSSTAKSCSADPRTPRPRNLLYPQVARLDLPPMHGAHTVFPMLGVDVPEFAKNLLGRKRDFIVVTDEAIQKECLEGRQMVWFVDITTETKPFGVASWTVPEASGNFCSRGGRFGTHSSNESYAAVYYKRLMFFAHFNAGVRVLDVRNPFSPREVAFYIRR